MNVTDKEALKVLRKAKSDVVYELVESYPDDEIDNKSELEIVLDEISYLVWMYEDDSTLEYEDLKYSKQVLKDTDNGTGNVVLLPSFNFKYSKTDIENAKATVAEYKRLKKILKEYGWA